MESKFPQRGVPPVSPFQSEKDKKDLGQVNLTALNSSLSRVLDQTGKVKAAQKGQPSQRSKILSNLKSGGIGFLKGLEEGTKRGLALGAYVSFSGILTYKSAEDIRDVAAEVPLDRLLVETDAPYLAPVPFRGKTNEPAFVAKTLERLAEIKGLAPADMAHITSDNFFRLFAKATRPERFTRAA